MSTYFVVNSTITDQEKLMEYQRAVGPTLAGHDVKVVAATNDASPLEGTSAGARMVIMEFPTREALLAWYNSDAYQNVIGLRFAATSGFGMIVEGFK